jgi:hypothetical protein
MEWGVSKYIRIKDCTKCPYYEFDEGDLYENSKLFCHNTDKILSKVIKSISAKELEPENVSIPDFCPLDDWKFEGEEQ